jgi:hypothetical protein
MHAALQLRAHSPQLLHLAVSIVGRSRENRDNIPRNVPTGQMVLQYVLPPRHESIAIITNVAAATENVAMLLIHTGAV